MTPDQHQICEQLIDSERLTPTERSFIELLMLNDNEIDDSNRHEFTVIQEKVLGYGTE